MQSVERLRGDLTESCRDAAVAPTAGEEFSFQLQHLTEDLFSVGFFKKKYLFYIFNARVCEYKKLCLVIFLCCEWRRAHLQQSA